MSQLAGPPDDMTRPSIGEQLDARLDRDVAALTHLHDRVTTLGALLAKYATDLADTRQTVAHMQRRAGGEYR